MTNILEKIRNDQVDYRIAEEGIVNTTYITNDLVVQEPEKGRENKLRKNIYICNILSENGAPVPKIVEMRENPFYVAYEKIEGTLLKKKEEFNEEDYLEAVKNTGKAFAEIHNQNLDISGYGKPDPEQNFKRAKYRNWQTFVEEYIHNTLNYVKSEKFASIAERASELVNTETFPEQPESKILHLDHSPDNIIIKPDLNAMIIDFDDAYYGDPRFDLMHAEFSMSKRGIAVKKAFINGYKNHREIKYEDNTLNNYRALAILQKAKAGEWCLRKNKNVNFDEWSEGLESFLESIENQ